jgi:hypothetical protein
MQYDSSLKYAGFVRDFDRAVYRGDVDNGAFLAGYYVRDKLKAVATLGMAGDFTKVAELIKAGIEVPREVFEQPGDDWLENVWQSIDR